MDYDVKKIKHDLAIAYAKSKLDHALATSSVPEPIEADNDPEIEYLVNQFYAALSGFEDYDDSMFIG